MTTFSYEFKTPAYTGKVDFPTGVFIDGKFSEGSGKTTIEYVSPHYLPIPNASAPTHRTNLPSPPTPARSLRPSSPPLYRQLVLTDPPASSTLPRAS